MKRMRLKDDHPTAEKLSRVWELMEKLGLTLEVSRYGETTVYDRDQVRSFDFQDIEEGEDSVNKAPHSFPPLMETKLTFQS